MSPLAAGLVFGGVGFLVVLLVLQGLRQVGWLGGRRRKTSRAGGALGVLNDALQPHLPTVEQVQRLNEGAENDSEDDAGAPPST